MRSLMFALAAATVAVAGAAAQDAKPAEAKAVVEKAIKAHGGAAALDKYPASTSKFKGQMALFGLDIDFTGDLTAQLPDKVKMTIDADINGMKMAFVQVVNGDKVKNMVGGQATPVGDKEKAELKMMLKMLEVSNLTPLLTDKYTIKAEKDDKVADADAAVVLVTGKDFKDTRLFFDKKTGLLVKTVRQGLAPEGPTGGTKEVTEETVMSEFKVFDGVKQPTKSVVNHDGKKFMTMTVTEMKMMAKADPKAFALDD